MKNSTKALELILADGTRFKIEAYTWKTFPRKGVRFDIYEGDELSITNCDLHDVLGFITAQSIDQLRRMVPNDS